MATRAHRTSPFSTSASTAWTFFSQPDAASGSLCLPSKAPVATSHSSAQHSPDLLTLTPSSCPVSLNCRPSATGILARDIFPPSLYTDVQSRVPPQTRGGIGVARGRASRKPNEDPREGLSDRAARCPGLGQQEGLGTRPQKKSPSPHPIPRPSPVKGWGRMQSWGWLARGQAGWRIGREVQSPACDHGLPTVSRELADQTWDFQFLLETPRI